MPNDLWSVPFFFFNDTATTEIYTLSLHDALPIWDGSVHLDGRQRRPLRLPPPALGRPGQRPRGTLALGVRSEEHTSELQSRQYLVCRLLLEKTKKLAARRLLSSINIIAKCPDIIP